MDRRLLSALICACTAFAAVPCTAQTASAAPATAAPGTAPAPAPAPAAARVPLARLSPAQVAEATEPSGRGEPNVTHSVIEDKGSKIDQLTVRGQVQHVVVTPKIGLTAPYEIIVGPEGRDPFGGGTGGARSAAGNRVWNVLKF
jgi:hypothetical protein